MLHGASRPMLSANFLKRLGFNSRSPLAWYFIVVLVCANLAIFGMLGVLWSSYGHASGPADLNDNAPQLLLPDPAQTPEPTSTATSFAPSTSRIECAGSSLSSE